MNKNAPKRICGVKEFLKNVDQKFGNKKTKPVE
jgi:hypothetical protein